MKEKDIASLVVQLIIFIVLIALFSIAIGILSAIPIIGVVFWVLASLVDLYSLIGIVLCIVNFFGLIK